jgi:hypothetical protein
MSRPASREGILIPPIALRNTFSGRFQGVGSSCLGKRFKADENLFFAVDAGPADDAHAQP